MELSIKPQEVEDVVSHSHTYCTVALHDRKSVENATRKDISQLSCGLDEIHDVTR